MPTQPPADVCVCVCAGGGHTRGSEDSEEGQKSAAKECVCVYVVQTIVSHQCVCMCVRLTSPC